MSLRRAGFAALILALACAGSAHAEEKLVEARRVFGFLSEYRSLTPAERSRFTLNYALRKDGKPARFDIVLVEANGVRTPLPVGEDGRILRLPTAAQMAGKPQVGIDASAGKVAVAMLVESTQRPAAEMPTAPFAPGLAQVNAAVSAKLGMIAALVPQVNRVTFVGAPSGVAVMPNGQEFPLPMAKEGPTFDPQTFDGARSVKFPVTPVSIRYEADR